MLSFNFFDSNEWEVVSNEAMKDKIKALEKEICMNDEVIDVMQNKIATLKADNDTLRNLNENMKGDIKNNSDYISALSAKIERLEAENKKLLAQNRVRDGVISLSSELNTKIDNQRKEITHLLKAQEKLKAEIANKEQIISSLDAKCNIMSKKVRELEEGIHTPNDLAWKDKYEALKISSDQAISALQKKCAEIKNNRDLIDTNGRLRAELVKANNAISSLKEENEKLKMINQIFEKESVNAEYGVANRKKDYSISYLENRVKNLEEENRELNKSVETFKKIIDLIHGKE